MKSARRSGTGSTVVGVMLVVGALLAGAHQRVDTAGRPAAGEGDQHTGPHDSGSAEEQRGGILGWVDLFQQRHRPLAFVVGVIRKFGDDQAGRLAALIAYYGFFSLFPLLLAATSVLVYVVGDDGAQDLRDSALAQIPVIGTQLTDGIANNDKGSGVAVVVGIAVALWAGLGCMQAAQDAMNEVWDIPRVARPGFVPKRIRSMLTLVILGLAIAISTTALQIVTSWHGLSGVSRVGVIVIGVVMNAGVFLLAFKVLVSGHLSWGDLVPGAIVGGVGYSALQLVGRWYVNRSISGASDTYGSFAVVIGLLSWLYLLGQLVVLAAEVNVVRARRLWPRSIFPPKLTRADQQVMSAAVRSQQTRPEQDIEVSYRA
ncbi:MAG: YihY/virulence factor BrkB family protein [Acidimicrobiia bacterium]